VTVRRYSGGTDHVQVHVENVHQKVVPCCLKGRRVGMPLLSKQHFNVTLDDNSCAQLRNLRVREVTANHGGTAFSLVISLTHVLSMLLLRVLT